MLGALKNSGIELEVKDLGITTHVVPGFQGNDVKIKECTVHGLHMREVKKKSKRGIRTMATRSPCKRLTDCANRASLLTVRLVVVAF